MKTRSKIGNLLSKLPGLDIETLKPVEVPETLRTLDEPVKLAYCPLLAKYSHRSLCSSVECRGCLYLRLEYEFKDTIWLCTKCEDLPQVRALPFWSDGACSCCGYETSVLLLCEVLDP